MIKKHTLGLSLFGMILTSSSFAMDLEKDSWNGWNPFRNDHKAIELINRDKNKNNFQPISYSKLEVEENTNKEKVEMGQLKWMQTSEDKFLFTDKIQDCVATILIGEEKVGLGHISYDPKDLELLDEELSKLEKPETFKVFLLSMYYSSTLDKVVDVFKNKNIKINGADILDNYIEYFPSMCMGPKFFCYSDSKNMQAQNMSSRQIYLQSKTKSISKELKN